MYARVDFKVLSFFFLVFAFIAGVIWKASRLRADIIERWRQRVKLAKAALSEEAIRELKKLRNQINDLIQTEEVRFDPVRALVDPSILLDRVVCFKRLIDVRNKLDRDFKLMLKLPIVILAAAIGGLVGVSVLTVGYFKIFSHALMPYFGWSLVGVAIVVTVISWILYARFEHRFSGAEILTLSSIGSDDDA